MEIDAREVICGEGEKYTLKCLVMDPDDIEKIEIPPFSELIPDEYEHSDNKKGLVIVFHSKFDCDNVTFIKNEFCDQGYDVSESNIFKLTTKQAVLTALDSVATNDGNAEKTCLIIFFLGSVEREDQFLLDEEESAHVLLKDVWLRFSGDKCPAFKKKPKVCIFQACSKPILTTFDARMMTGQILPKGAYDLPSEADMLLVYQRIKDSQHRSNFIVSLCNKIAKFGHKDDIISLITRTVDANEARPLVISTLTRKFYIANGTNRGLHHAIHHNHTNTMESLEKLQKMVYKKIREGRPLHSASTSRNITEVDFAKPKTSKLNKGTEKAVPKKLKLVDRPRWK